MTLAKIKEDAKEKGSSYEVTPVSRTRLGLYVILLGCLWGANFSFSKMGMMNHIPLFAYGFWHSLTTGLALLALCFWQGRPPKTTPVRLRYYITTALFSLSLPMMVILTVVQHIPSGLVAVVVTLAPIFTYSLAMIMGFEKLSYQRIFGLCFGFSGAIFLVLPRFLDGDSTLTESNVFFLILAFLIPLSFAINNVYAARRRPKEARSTALAAGMMLSSALVMGFMLLIQQQFYLPSFPPSAADYVFLSHATASTLAAILVFEIIRHAGPILLSQANYVVTMAGMLWGYLLFGEMPSPTIWVGVAFIFVGLGLVNYKRKPRVGQVITR